ncbi:6-bladed beta-propeller [Algoriphagus sp.]|uniref:6-bladed beta-propeller n=1 Tax=Algoriphagus sp. TaxID=1872435 RepID=UPI00391AE1C5
MNRLKFGVVLIATLFLFSACKRQKNEVTETGNSKFLSFVGSDSLSTEFIFSEGDPVVLNLDQSQIDAKIKLSDLMKDYRMLSLKNWEGGVVGNIDKILLSDSLVFILDQNTFNSLQIFDLFTGEQVGLFYPTGEGPGEMKIISEFDLDEANRRILIYDNSLAKVLSFSF